MKNKISLYISFLLVAVHFSVVTSKAETIKHTSERIHVHVQKNVFLVGESVLYKLYCINSQTQKPSMLSRVAYIELVDENGFSVAQNEVVLNKGLGNGGFLISEQLPSGNYAINAYTHWMNTTSKELINVTPIFVFNNYNLNPNRIDSLKKPSRETEILDVKNNQIKLLDNVNSSEIKQNFSIKTDIEDLDRILNIHIQRENQSLSQSDNYNLQIFSRNGKIVDEKFKLSDGKWHFQVYKKELKSSICAICIVDKNDVILSNTLIHLISNKNGQYIEKPQLNTSSRKNISLDLKIEDLSSDADEIYLSASIKLKEPFIKPTNIIDYFNLFSDIGSSMNPYYNSLNKVSNQSWIAKNDIQFLWTKTPSEYKVNSNQYPENESYVLEGQIKEGNTKNAVVDQNVYLSKIGEFADISTFRTNSDGKFFFQLPLKKGFHDISIQLTNEVTTECSIQLKEKFNQEGISPVSWKKEDLSEDQLKFIKQRYENTRIQKIYEYTDFIEVKDSSLYRGKENFFGKPFLSVKIDEFIRLDSLEEYFHEFIAPIKIKYRKKKTFMNVYNNDQLRVMDQKPLILFDGLIIPNPRTILNKRPDVIDRIEVVPYEYFYGKSHFYGIIHAISKEQNCKLDELPDNTERYYLPLFANTYQLKEQINIPNKFSPDFRTDLLWEPNITLTKNDEFKLEFTTSDVKGEYELKIEGLTKEGKPIVYLQDIIVE